MQKFKISFVQPNFKIGPGGIAYHLPYSCGLLWANAQKSEIIKKNFKLHKLIYKRDLIEDVAKSLCMNDVIAFSTYVWNRSYNFKLAKRIKELNKNVLIIFGGPEPPISNPDIFTEIMPFADIVVKGEGEITFKLILESFVNKTNYNSIAGLLINNNGKLINTGNGERISALDEIPSPYLTDIFKDIIPLEKEWNGALETNRGCPYKCTFCDWGSLTYSKIKMFGMDRVFNELEWMGENKIGFLDIVDSNFGLFVERDNLIVDKLIEVQQNKGYPYRTGWSWAKNQQSEVVQIAKKLINSGHFNNGLTISLQSLGENTLKTIKRMNMGINKINEIFAECRRNGVPLNVELIVGLPGESLKSWEDTLYGVFEVGQHDSIEVWQAQILENAELNLSQRLEYKIKGQKVLDYFPNGIDNEAPEFSEIITETSTMSLNEMIEAYKLSWYLITWHTGGFSQIIARFLRRYKNESYKDFYTKFRKFLQKDNLWKSEEDKMENIIRNWYVEGKQINDTLGPLQMSANTNQYRTIFKIHNEDLYNHFYNLVENFLEQYELDAEIYKELILLNRCLVSKHNKFETLNINLKYNIFEFITDNIVDFRKENNQLKIYYPHDPIRSKDKAWFMESIFFARRRSYGKNFISKI